ncbi:MAG TPA: DUF58 domain-containing protein [Fimbriimonas sp.]|nr:DUF58 domain-containing protein [Fimbriimonas sp.]
MVPTKRFWLLVALGIPIAAVSASIGAPLLAVAYDLLLILAAWITTRLAPDGASLRVSRAFDPVLSVRAWNKIRLKLENDGVESVSLVVRDEPPALFQSTTREFSVRLQPGDQADFEYTVRPKERGSDSFQGTFVRVRCPFGLAYKQLKLDTTQDVRVYPNVLALREFDLLRQQGRLREIGIRRSRFRGLGSDFESLRQYTEGDDFRKIDWKATARRGEVVVRQFEQERNQVVIVCIDIGRHMLSEVDGVRKLDHVLDSLLMLANAATIAGDLIGLVVFADNVRRYLPPRKGRNQMGLVIEACHDLVAEPLESDLGGAMAYLSQRWNRRSLVVTFTDCEDPDRARELLNAFVPVSRRHLALLCRISDPRINEVELAPTATLRDAYAKTAATLLTEDRKAAYSIMTSAGVHVLDSEPQDLAANLVNFYFSVKERSLL